MPQYRPLGIGNAPASWLIPDALTLQLEAAFAHFDGSGAAGSYFPCLKIVSDAGETVAMIPMDADVAAGSSVEASWAPFLRTGGGAGGGGSVPIVGYASFAPAAGFIQVTSTDETNPTTIQQSGSFTADGTTLYRIDFYVAAVDIKVSGNGTGAALLMNLHRDTTDIGRVFDYNIAPTGGNYGSVACAVSVFDTPPAGVHTYTMTAWRNQAGCTTTSFVYGSNTGPPFTGVTHPGFIAAIKVSTS